MDIENNNKPKVFGQLGLDISKLKNDVEGAKNLLKELANEAEKLGKFFGKAGEGASLDNLSKNLKKTANEMRNVTDGIAKQYEGASKKIAEAQAKIVESIAHRHKIGELSPEQANIELQEYIQTLKANNKKVEDETKRHQAELDKINNSNRSKKGWATRKGTEYVPTDTAEQQTALSNLRSQAQMYTSELVKAESYLEDLRRAYEKAEQAFQKSLSKADQQELNDMFAKAREQADVLLEQKKNDYKMGVISHREYYNQLKAIEEEYGEWFTEKEKQRKFTSEQNNAVLAFDKEIKQQQAQKVKEAEQQSAKLQEIEERLAEQTRKTIKESAQAQLQELKNNHSAGILKHEEYYKELQKLRKKYEKYFTGKEVATKFGAEEARAIREMDKEFDDIIESNRRKREESEKQQLSALRESLNAELELQKTRYQQGLIEAEEYVAQLKRIQNQGAESGAFGTPENVRVAKEVVRAQVKTANSAVVDAEKEVNAKRLEMWRNTQHQISLNRSKDLQEQKKYLEQQLKNEELNADQIRKVKEKLARVDDKIRNESLAEQKRIDKALLKSRQEDYDSNHKRFRGLTDYAFDSTIIYGAIQGVRQMTNSVRELESEFVNLARVMPEANELDLSQMRDDAFDIANLSAQNVIEVTKIQNLWARTSDEIAKNKQAMEELTKVTAVGMNVGGFDNAEEAVQLLSASLNQMGLGWMEAGRVMDSWVKTADATAVKTAKDLANVIMDVGVQAKNFGLGIDEINAMTGLFANNMARSGEEVGTAMRTIFSYFQDETTIKTLKKYGVEVKKTATEYHNFVYIMEQLQETYRKLDAVNNQVGIREINNALGRIRRVDYVGTLISNWDETGKILKDSMDSMGYAMEQNEKIMNTFQSKVQQLQNEFSRMAWSIGESGLLDDLKSLVMGVASGIEWFNGLDSSTKTLILRFIELSVAWSVLNRSVGIFLKMNAVQTIGNIISQMGLWAGSQGLVNAGLKLGANLVRKDTGELIGNTTAKNLNFVATVQSTNATRTDGIAILDHTGKVLANKKAIDQKTASQLQSNAVQTSLGATLKSMLNPMTLLVIAIGVAVSAFVTYREAQRKAKEEAEKFKQVHEELVDSLNKRVVQEHELEGYKKRLGQLEELEERYKGLKNRIDEAQEAIDEFNETDFGSAEIRGRALAGSNVRELIVELPELKRELAEVEKEMAEFGVTTKDISGFIEEHIAIVNRSSDSLNREAYSIMELIKEKQSINEQTRKDVAEYDRLVKTTNRTVEQNERLRRLTIALSSAFATSAGSINKQTGLVSINTKAILDEIGAMGSLTASQRENITVQSQLTEASKQRAISMIRVELSLLDATVKASRDRTDAMIKEVQEIDQKFRENPLLANMLGSKMARDEKRKALDEEMKKTTEVIGQTRNLRDALREIENIKPFDPKDFEGGGVGGDADKIKKFADLTKLKLQEIDHAVKLLTDSIKALGDSDEDMQEKIKLTLKLQELEAIRLKELQNLNTVYTQSLAKTNKEIDKYIKGWSTMTSEQRIQAYGKASEKTKDKIDSLIDSFSNLTKELQDLDVEMKKSLEVQKSLTKDMVDLVALKVKESLQIEKQINQKRLQAKHDAEILKLEKQIYGVSKQQFDLEINKAIKVQQDKLKQLDEEISKREYINRLADINAEIEKVKADTRFAYIDEATGKEIYTYDRARVKELEKERGQEYQRQADEALRKSYENEIERLTEYKEDKDRIYDESIEDLRKFHENELQAFEEFWNQRLEQEAIQQTALELIKQNGYSKALTEVQKHLKDYKKKYDDFQQPMYDTGKALNSALLKGLQKDMDAFIKAKQDEMYALAKAIRSSFESGLWGDFPSPTPASGGKLPASYTPVAPKVALSPINLPESVATVLKGNSNTIYIDKINANNFNELMASLNPYIESNK